MANPVLVEVTRGQVVESVHRGAVCVMDGDGTVVLRCGDIDGPVFPRSAVKAIQALPLVESGAADAFGFGDRELALACASHSGEPAHAERAASMLAAAGLDASDLECGWHWPINQEAGFDLARAGEMPSALHNNCSGKHAGFLCTCRHLGLAHRGYVEAGHRAQDMVREVMETVTGASHGADSRGTDGCSIPTYAVPLASLARGFARMATGVSLAPARAAAARRILAATMAAPYEVAGTGRLDTLLMRAAEGRVMVKTGAEGVYCGAVPELGVGLAIKCDDGGTRAAEVAALAVLLHLFRNDTLAERLAELARRPVTSRRNVPVGEERFVAALA